MTWGTVKPGGADRRKSITGAGPVQERPETGGATATRPPPFAPAKTPAQPRWTARRAPYTAAEATSHTAMTKPIATFIAAAAMRPSSAPVATRVEAP